MRNGEIVFLRHFGPKDLRLYSVQPDGSEVRPLLDGPLRCESPAWSPDGSRLAVIAPGDQDTGMFLGEIHVMHADGSALTRITHEPSVKLRPTWSPNGSEIVFQRSVGSSGYHLFAVGADGTGQRQITGPEVQEAGESGPVGEVRGWTSYVSMGAEPYSSEEMPAWSPDGSRIAFVRAVPVEPREPGDPSFAHRLFTVAADGTDEREVTGGLVHDHDPAWSPDGSNLVFARSTDDERIEHNGGSTSAVRLCLAHPDGTGLERLADEPANYMDPAWAPDGSAIVCSRSLNGPTHIFRFDLEERRGSPITFLDVDGITTRPGDRSPSSDSDDLGGRSRAGLTRLSDDRNRVLAITCRPAPSGE